ncbi:MAG: hypothetical protein ACKOEX_06105 [Planctomycetia bacterium]
MAPRSSCPVIVRRITVIAGRLALAAACLAAWSQESNANPRTERLIDRRLDRIEAIERRAEAEARMPPRPADVRRAIRRGEPLPDAEAKAARPAPAPRGTANTPPRPATARTARPAPALARPTPAPVTPSPAVPMEEPPAPVSQATAIDDGTRSVLIREPKPAAAAELLPTPSPK